MIQTDTVLSPYKGCILTVNAKNIHILMAKYNSYFREGVGETKNGSHNC